MPQVRSGASSGKKWASRSAAAAPDYKSGVANPRRSWAQSTADAQDAYVAGVTEAASRGSFAAGVQAAGDSKWQRKSQTVGAQRFASGVQAAQQDYETGFAPYKQVIENVVLPPKGPKGSPGNYARSQAVGEALRAAKVAGASN